MSEEDQTEETEETEESAVFPDNESTGYPDDVSVTGMSATSEVPSEPQARSRRRRERRG